MTRQPSPSHRQWYEKVIEVSDAYTHDAYEIVPLGSLRIMPNVKVFVPQDGRTDGRRLADRTNTTDYIDPRTTHMDHTTQRKQLFLSASMKTSLVVRGQFNTIR